MPGKFFTLPIQATAALPGGSFIPENLLRLTVSADIVAGTISTVDAGNLPAGYVSLANNAFSSATSVSLTPSSAGDQLLIFQSPNPSSTVGFLGITAINSSSTSWGSSSTSQTESDLYPGMINGTNALAVGAGSGPSDEWDNVRYNGPTTGNSAFLLSELYKLSNWEGTNDLQSDYVGWTNQSGSSSFTIVPEPSSALMFSLFGFVAIGRRQRR